VNNFLQTAAIDVVLEDRATLFVERFLANSKKLTPNHAARAHHAVPARRVNVTANEPS
jgi:hypothetical protein